MTQTSYVSSSIEHDFYGFRIVDDRVIPCHWTMEYSVVSKNGTQDKEEMLIAYQKVKYWIDVVLNDLLIAHIENQYAANISYMMENMIMFTPHQPDDGHIAEILYSKLNAIGGDIIDVVMVKIRNRRTKVTHFYDTEDEYSLPKADYLEDIYHDIPWWGRNDFDTMDYTVEEIKEDETLREYVEGIDPIQDFENQLRNNLKALDESEDEAEEKSAEIIKMPTKWKPKLV